MSTQSTDGREADTLAEPAARNIRAIVELERQALRRTSLGGRIGQAICDFVGTMFFVSAHSALMMIWIGWNVSAPHGLRFDPYPFGLLTFIVSLEGVLIATFVLIAQNRMGRQSDQRDHLNLQVSLLAEQEMTLVLRLLRRMSEKLEVPAETADEAHAVQLTEETNVFELVQRLQRELPDLEKS